MYDVIHCRMLMVATFTLTATKTLCCKAVYFLSTVVACVGSAQGGIQTKACCYSDGILCRPSDKTSSTFSQALDSDSGGEQTNTGSGIWCTLQQRFCHSRCLGGMPGPLLLLGCALSRSLVTTLGPQNFGIWNW